MEKDQNKIKTKLYNWHQVKLAGKLGKVVKKANCTPQEVKEVLEAILSTL